MDFRALKNLKESVKSLMLHHRLIEKARLLIQATRRDDYKLARSLMSLPWQDMTPLELKDMLARQFPLLRDSVATHFELVMDDGTQAVLDTYLRLRGGHWVPCDIRMVREAGDWLVDRITIRLEVWQGNKSSALRRSEMNPAEKAEEEKTSSRGRITL